MQHTSPYSTALVTGATRGIGEALVQRLVEQGFKVFVTGRDEARLNSIKSSYQVDGMLCDLENPDQVIALFHAAEQSLGKVEVLINNAGFNSRKAPIAETSLEEFEAQYAVNMRAPYLLCREALKSMQPSGKGYIINIISTVAKRINPTMGVYTATKSGFDGLNGVIMKEAQPHGIKVTAVYPGGVNTEFRDQPRPQYIKPESAAYMISELLFNPEDVVVHELTFRPMVELE